MQSLQKLTSKAWQLTVIICIDSASVWDWVTPSVRARRHRACTVCSVFKMKVILKIRRVTFNSKMGRHFSKVGPRSYWAPQTKSQGPSLSPLPRFRRLCCHYWFTIARERCMSGEEMERNWQKTVWAGSERWADISEDAWAGAERGAGRREAAERRLVVSKTGSSAERQISRSRSSHVPLLTLRSHAVPALSVPHILDFFTCMQHAQVWKQQPLLNCILRDDKTRCDENFYRVHHSQPLPKFVWHDRWVLTSFLYSVIFPSLLWKFAVCMFKFDIYRGTLLTGIFIL